jgi:hypothetical protein
MSDSIVDSITKAVEDATAKGGKAEIRINPTVVNIPPHIAGNILTFLQRAQSTGMEAIAWVEAYQFVQQHVPQQGQPQGVPFTGLPPKK